MRFWAAIAYRSENDDSVRLGTGEACFNGTLGNVSDSDSEQANGSVQMAPRHKWMSTSSSLAIGIHPPSPK